MLYARHPRRWCQAALPPPHSPDLNQIEKVFAELKHWPRQAQAKFIEGIHCSLETILERFHSKDCAAYLANSGYDSD